jgi:beta-mannosidase
MHIQSLSGKWQFREIGTGVGSVPGPGDDLERDPGKWSPAQVPGSAHTDLLALDRIPDPFVADNELRVQWVAERDWEYRRVFEISSDLLAEERVFLVCDGLDTLAKVTLNGQPLGHTDNMFRRYRWDVTHHLVEGENELHVVFSSPVAAMRARQEEQPLVGPSQAIPGGPHLRKAPCQFGWDWGPQLPPIGIWKDVRLEGYTLARLEDVHLRQRHVDGTVTLSARLAVEHWRDSDLKGVLRLIAPDGRTQEAGVVLKGDAMAGTLEIQVADPQLWWPNGYGAQPLYRVEVILYHGDTICDARSFQLGLRQIELRQEPDEFGTSFTFVVNGVPIFAKGANWIPADSFPTRLSDAHLEHLIHSSALAHMNMLRVWGGGLYEEERFYDLCDQYGILVWQDFVFSCSMYPDDDAFFENARVEAVENVRRLRHRASLALWCGNNEMEWGWDQWGWNEPDSQRHKAAYDRMFHHLLPEICAAEDPDHPYWPSSPSSNVPFEEPNGVQAGDTHNWEVWHGNRPFKGYWEHDSRFVSEFGFQSLPPLDTVRTYAGEADWNMTSYVMEHHQRNAAGNGKIISYMTDHFRLPRDFESLVYLTQLLQAEAVRTGVEYWRRNRRCTSGTLYWQLNDCWPVASWASLDYFGRWKALHYAARRFYAPVLLSAEDQGPQVTLHVVSDLTEEWQGTVRWSLETMAGEVLEAGEEAVLVPALSSVQACALDFADRVAAGPSITLREAVRRDVVLAYELWRGDERLSLGALPFVPNKHLVLGDPGLRTSVTEANGGFEVEITAQALARFVWLELDGTEVLFSDNYFDLPAGRTAALTFTAPQGWTVDRVRQALRVRTLVDSF